MNQIQKETVIIILVWNDYENTKATIDSVLKSEGVDYDILVVDNASTDGCIEKLREDYGSYDNISFLMNKENWGYAEGNNIALRYCMKMNYEYFFILNNDVIFDSPSCIHDLQHTLKEDDKIGIIAPLIWNRMPDGSFKKGSLVANSGLYKLMMKLNGIEIGSYKENLYSTPTVSGSFFAITRSCLNKVKGFEKNFFMYAEEDDLCIRTNLCGYRVIKLAKDYGIKHLGGVSNFIDAADWKRVIGFRNRMMLLRNFSFPQKFLYSSILFLQGIKNTVRLLNKCSAKSAYVYFLSFFEGLNDLISFKRLSKTDKLFNRGRSISQKRKLYGISIK